MLWGTGGGEGGGDEEDGDSKAGLDSGEWNVGEKWCAEAPPTPSEE